MVSQKVKYVYTGVVDIYIEKVALPQTPIIKAYINTENNVNQLIDSDANSVTKLLGGFVSGCAITPVISEPLR